MVGCDRRLPPSVPSFVRQRKEERDLSTVGTAVRRTRAVGVVAGAILLSGFQGPGPHSPPPRSSVPNLDDPIPHRVTRRDGVKDDGGVSQWDAARRCPFSAFLFPSLADRYPSSTLHGYRRVGVEGGDRGVHETRRGDMGVGTTCERDVPQSPPQAVQSPEGQGRKKDQVPVAVPES